jgi:hypothetical protein
MSLSGGAAKTVRVGAAFMKEQLTRLRMAQSEMGFRLTGMRRPWWRSKISQGDAENGEAAVRSPNFAIKLLSLFPKTEKMALKTAGDEVKLRLEAAKSDEPIL